MKNILRLGFFVLALSVVSEGAHAQIAGLTPGMHDMGIISTPQPAPASGQTQQPQTETPAVATPDQKQESTTTLAPPPKSE